MSPGDNVLLYLKSDKDYLVLLGGPQGRFDISTSTIVVLFVTSRNSSSIKELLFDAKEAR